MNTRRLRNLTFQFHRYIGLAVGLLLIIVGITGSILVFQREIDRAIVAQQFGVIEPQGERVAIASVIDTINTAYANQPEFKLTTLHTLPSPTIPYRAFLKSKDDKLLNVFVNPYTGAIIGERRWDQHWIYLTLKLHYALLAGHTGEVVMGIVAFLLFILSLSGIALWPGWRKLISGFKIKWNAHPKRTNYDLHKVAGIVTAVFLGAIAFTGFCWNFFDQAKPAIHAVTFTPIPAEPASTPLPGQTPLPLTELLQKADAALPNAATTFISLPQKPEAPLRVGKKFPQESWQFGSSRVFLDQYTGTVVQLQNGLQPTRAEAVLNSFVPLHYGTFGGIPTRIFYIFVGLAPLILFITGFIMWWYRKRKDVRLVEVTEAETVAKH